MCADSTDCDFDFFGMWITHRIFSHLYVITRTIIEDKPILILSLFFFYLLTGESMDWWAGRRMDGQMDEWMDGWMDGQMYRWADGWMCVYCICVCIYVCVCALRCELEHACSL